MDRLVQFLYSIVMHSVCNLIW